MIKTVIIDDERLGRVNLKRLLASIDNIEIIAEFDNAQALLDNVEKLAPDLIFLDIHMPNLSGIEAAARLGGDVNFIFCTAYAEYAVEAFDLKAADYLVKPVRLERLQQAIERCNFASRQPMYLSGSHQFLLKFDEIQRMVRLDQIERFEVVGNDIALYTVYGKSYLRTPISRLEQNLDSNKYFKANRSEIISLDKVMRFEVTVGATMLAIMQSSDQIHVSRRQTKELKRLHGNTFTE
ncbi:LytR/AlgR family response regulator transcription factor [Pseudoalteromonas aurantia]|uniref:DNA-binding response regulator n=1 Tax=Pseudoalteromonas aurantia TaxID=43654 RepID=A0A5S3V7A1_9GAMM|nr:LytTR family DNA-binding domain-containing protein [Pseudoalteromonas aurantia]TMO67008.1 DNA-binding response regulator [Pseudoalteromonas aurantia]TMO67375.1 DNA-binding response regulator [Pseudoalteromonas aurantia]TMO74725.1 DNA-binding response regulator [Pseudoalteromonas aurantia]